MYMYNVHEYIYIYIEISVHTVSHMLNVIYIYIYVWMCLQTRNLIPKPYWIATKIHHVSGSGVGVVTYLDTQNRTETPIWISRE